MVKRYLGLFTLLTTAVVVGMLWPKTEEPIANILTPMVNFQHSFHEACPFLLSMA
jgi:hypothetical protein